MKGGAVTENESQLQLLNNSESTSGDQWLNIYESATWARVEFEHVLKEMHNREFLNFMLTKKEIDEQRILLEQIEIENKLREEAK